jgi:hypothetical protein
MRFPRLQFTVRWMMVAVAVVAVCFWVLLIYQRQAEYRKRLSVYDDEARWWRSMIWLNEMRADVLRRRGVYDRRAAAEAAAITEDLERLRPHAAHLERLRQKYESAVWRAWLLVEPDPPAPCRCLSCAGTEGIGGFHAKAQSRKTEKVRNRN